MKKSQFELYFFWNILYLIFPGGKRRGRALPKMMWLTVKAVLAVSPGTGCLSEVLIVIPDEELSSLSLSSLCTFLPYALAQMDQVRRKSVVPFAHGDIIFHC